MKISYLTLEAARNGQASYTHIHEIIHGLKRRGCEITLYQPSYALKDKSPGLVLRLFHAIFVQMRFWAEYRKGTLIYIRAHYLAFPTALLAHIFKIPVVHEVNGPYEDVFVTYPPLVRVRNILIWLMRMQYRSATHLIGVTENIAAWLQVESCGVPVSVVPNGANTALFMPDLPKPSGLPDKFALFFGGLSRWHGIPDILKAFDNEEWPRDVELVIIGDGPETPLVKAGADANPHIHYLGKKSYKEMPHFIASALCGLVTINDPQGRSQTGLCPLKLFETLACGVPVIVTDFPGQADLVRNGRCGAVIPHDNPAELAKAVNFFAQDGAEAKAMGKRGYELILQSHSWDCRAAATYNILKAIADGNITNSTT